jgi:hypothetical protein
MADIDWLIGLGLMIGLALLFTYITYKDIITFFVWLNIFGGFVVWAQLLPLWIVVINLVVMTLILFNTFFSTKRL